jgi:hypothetical protein
VSAANRLRLSLLLNIHRRRMQSISNWFQHQRSMAKRRRASGVPEFSAPPPEPRQVASARRRSPERSSGSASARPKRLRPEPHQLEALKALYGETTNPSIEQRAALAAEYGMPESKVTNWLATSRCCTFT